MKKFPILYGLMLTLSMVSCTSDFDFSREDIDKLEVETRMVEFEPQQASRTLKVYSDVDWSVSEEVEMAWLEVEQLEDGVTLSVQVNEGILDREGTLLVLAGGRKTAIKVRQQGVVPTFITSRNEISVAYSGGVETIDVQTNVDWEARTYCDWMALTRTESGLSVTMTENTTERRRTSNVDFYNSGSRFARILISQESLSVQPPDYYSVNLSGLDWSVTYVYYIYGDKGNVVALVAKESLDENNPSVNMYPAPKGVPDFSSGVAVKSPLMYVSYDAVKIYDTDPRQPFEELADASHTPLILTTNVKTHGAVKVGRQIWLAEDYKTTKYVDGAPIDTYYIGNPFWTDGDSVVVIHDGHYLYTGYVLGKINDDGIYDCSNFAPEGWAVPTKEDYEALVVSTEKSFETLQNGIFGATLNYKALTTKEKTVDVQELGYTNTWTSTPNSSKLYMVGMRPTDVDLYSAQQLKACFSVRLIKK